MDEIREPKKNKRLMGTAVLVMLGLLVFCGIIKSCSSKNEKNEEQIQINSTSIAQTVIAGVSQTAEAIVPTNTEVPTPTNTLDPQVATAEAFQATQNYIALFKEIDYRELVNYSNNHVGEMVIARGQVFNIIDDQDFQMYFTGTYDSLYVATLDKYTGLYTNDYVTVYGYVYGEFCGTNAFGAEICTPALYDAFFVKQ